MFLVLGDGALVLPPKENKPVSHGSDLCLNMHNSVYQHVCAEGTLRSVFPTPEVYTRNGAR